VKKTKLLLDSGFPIDLLAADGLAPLHWALIRNDTSMLKFLMEQGSPVDIRAEEGATPLMLAVEGAMWEKEGEKGGEGGKERQSRIEKIVFLLDQGADSNAVDAQGFTALHRAAELGNEDIVRLLLERGADPTKEAQGYTPYVLAQKSGRKEVINLLSKRSIIFQNLRKELRNSANKMEFFFSDFDFCL